MINQWTQQDDSRRKQRVQVTARRLYTPPLARPVEFAEKMTSARLVRGAVAALLVSCCTALSVRPAVRPLAAVAALRAPVSMVVTPDMLPTSALLASTSGVVAAVSQQQLVLAVRERTLMPSHCVLAPL